MELINNITKTLSDDLSAEIKKGSKLSIAAACFSIYAFQKLKKELQGIEELRSYEGNTDLIDDKLNTTRSIDDIFKSAQRVFNI